MKDHAVNVAAHKRHNVPGTGEASKKFRTTNGEEENSSNIYNTIFNTYRYYRKLTVNFKALHMALLLCTKETRYCDTRYFENT